VTWLESNEPSYILYTSGTTGKPKGVQRDVGGYAVALASTMKYVYNAQPGETMFTTSDIGWVVGHSYIIYGPLMHGMTTIVYEGLPIRPDPGIWWKIVQDHKVTTMFSSPTAIRVLKKQDPAWLKKYDLQPALSVPGRRTPGRTHLPLDFRRPRRAGAGPLLADGNRLGHAQSYLPGVDLKPNRFGSPGFPAYGFNIRIVNEMTGADCGPNEKGVLTVVPPLPPGCLTTVWGDDKRFINSYFGQFEKELLYTSSDWAVRDADGYTFILGRTDDVINTAGHRLGTREIEEALQAHPAIAEVAVVGLLRRTQGPGAGGLLHGERPEPHRRRGRPRRPGEILHRQGGGTARPGGQAPQAPLRQRLAQDPLRQAAAPLHPGPGGRPGDRRSVHPGRPQRAGGNPQGGGQVTVWFSSPFCKGGPRGILQRSSNCEPCRNPP
jgi:propionyl-CoA synthetase